MSTISVDIRLISGDIKVISSDTEVISDEGKVISSEGLWWWTFVPITVFLCLDCDFQCIFHNSDPRVTYMGI